VVAGADGGVRDRAALEAALARPGATFAGEPLYGSPFARAAALMDSIVQQRPFAGANRAVAVMAAGLSLEREGYRLEAAPEELTQTVLAAAAGALEVDGVAFWLREHTVRLAA
jgi:death on curing protein